MARTFIPPWGADQARYPFKALEAHTALCRAMDVPDKTPPLELRQLIIAATPEAQQAARASMLDAVEQAEQMYGWAPADHTTETAPYLAFTQNRGFEHYAYWGGRGGGKSHGIADGIIEQASTGLERVVCGREFQNSIKDSVKELLETKIKNSRFANQWVSTEYELRNVVTGSRITFIGMNRNPNSAKSLEGCTIFWGEEAQTFSSTSLEIILPTIRSAGSRCVWSWNPSNADAPIDSMFRSGTLPERSYICCVLVEDNPYFYTGRMPGEMRTAWNNATKAKFRHIWRGAYDERPEGLVYQNWTVGRPAGIDNLQPMYGLDWGWVDPFAALEVYIIEPKDPETARGIIYIAAEAYGSYIPANQIPETLDAAFNGRARTHYLTADSSEPKSIDDLGTAGFAVFGAVKGPGSIRAGISFIQGYDIWVSPDCVNFQAELAAYKWKTTARDNIILSNPEDKDNHACDALRYAVEDYIPPTADGGASMV